MNEENWQSRTELLLGAEKVDALRNKHILVVGLGGVGAYAAEQLCRAGIGRFTLVDCDVVQASNRNRQLIALVSSMGKRKTKLVEERMLDINPECQITLLDEFINAENIPKLLENNYDFIVDAIDTLTPKVDLLTEAVNRNLKVISSFGSGGKTDPTQIQVSDIKKSYGCKFGYKVRKEIYKRNIRTGIKVVFSPEKVDPTRLVITDGTGNKRSVVGTISYMPAVFGCFCAAEVIRDILETIEADSM